jgi:hypothetical protein
MKQTPNTLSDAEQAEIELIHKIYRDFRTKLSRLERKQNSIINAAIKRIDHNKTEQVLKQLKQS